MAYRLCFFTFGELHIIHVLKPMRLHTLVHSLELIDLLPSGPDITCSRHHKVALNILAFD
jgi:hypothetical protein